MTETIHEFDSNQSYVLQFHNPNKIKNLIYKIFEILENGWEG